MADVILRVVQGDGFERGNASMVSITALAIGGIRLYKEVNERLRRNIKLALPGHTDAIKILFGEESPF